MDINFKIIDVEKFHIKIELRFHRCMLFSQRVDAFSCYLFMLMLVQSFTYYPPPKAEG